MFKHTLLMLFVGTRKESAPPLLTIIRSATSYNAHDWPGLLDIDLRKPAMKDE